MKLTCRLGTTWRMSPESTTPPLLRSGPTCRSTGNRPGWARDSTPDCAPGVPDTCVQPATSTAQSSPAAPRNTPRTSAYALARSASQRIASG